MDRKLKYLKMLEDAAKLRAKVEKAYVNGKSQAQIAREMNVSRQRVNQILNDNANKARRSVQKAVIAKRLPRPSTLKCVDCGIPSEAYDHRDYSKRLEVEPVCMVCNYSRGIGRNSSSTPILRRVRKYGPIARKEALDLAKMRKLLKKLGY